MTVTTTSTGTTSTGTTGAAAPAAQTGTESSLSNWAGPYVTEMLGRGQALASTPYQAYTGPLTAGPSALQTQAFQGIANLVVPTDLTTAADTAGKVATSAGNLSYSPTTFTSQFTAPSAYQSGTFGNQFTAPADVYKAQDITTGAFTPEMARQYMSPYLQESLNPQLNEARRQADIQRSAEAARLAQAGAYGGSRQAIMESEGSRNLLRNLSDITGRGYETAYQQAGQMFTADQARALQAAQANQSARQAAGQQALTASQLQAQYGLSAQQAQEASKQFAAQQGLNAAQLAAQYGLSANQATEASKQFGAQYGIGALAQQLQAAQAQSGLSRAALQSDLEKIQAQSGLGSLQRSIDQEGIAADLSQFREERDYPYKQVQYMQSLLQGLPIGAQSYSYQEPSALEKMLGGVGGLQKLYDLVFGTTKPPTTPPTNPTTTTN